MPRIPIDNSQASVSFLPGRPQASADVFGSANGQALAAAGGALMEAGKTVREYNDRIDQISASDAAATLRQQYTSRYLDISQSQPEGMRGFGELIGNDFDVFAQNQTQGLSDGARAHMRETLNSMRLQFVEKATVAEATSTSHMVQRQAESSLATRLATIALDPTQYRTVEAEGLQLIASTPMNADARAELTKNFRYKAADAMLMARLDQAKTTSDFAAIKAMMADPSMRDRIDPKDVHNVNQHIKMAEEKAMRESDQQAHAGLSWLEGRMQAGLDVPPNEMAIVQQQVLAARNPLHASRFADLMVTMRTRQQVAGMPAAAIDAEAARTKSGVSPATPPPDVTAGMRAALQRDPSRQELYIATEVGKDNPQLAAASTVAILKAASDTPDAKMGDVAPGVGRADQSVTQYLQEKMKGYATGVSHLDFVRAQALEAQSAEVKKATSGDIMTYAAQHQQINLQPITDEASAALRGKQAVELARIHSMPNPRPLTESELADATKTLNEAPVPQVVGLFKRLEAMGPEAAKGALLQLGERAPTYAHAAALTTQGPLGMATAEEIIRGRRRMEEDKPGSIAKLQTPDHGTEVTFDRIVGTALDGLKPDARKAIRDAADALYVQRTPTGKAWDEGAYAQAVSSVLGGTGVAVPGLVGRKLGTTPDGLGVVNGKPTALPAGVDESKFKTALAGLTTNDLATISTNGKPPINLWGEAVPAEKVARLGEFRAIGGNQYLVLMPDGRPLSAGRDERTGTAVPYVVKLAPDTIDRLSKQAPPGTPWWQPQIVTDLKRSPATPLGGRR